MFVENPTYFIATKIFEYDAGLKLKGGEEQGGGGGEGGGGGGGGGGERNFFEHQCF